MSKRCFQTKRNYSIIEIFFLFKKGEDLKGKEKNEHRVVQFFSLFNFIIYLHLKKKIQQP